MNSLILMPIDRPILSRFIFFALGCLTTTAFAPFGWYVLVPLLLLPLLFVCLTQAPRDAAKFSFWYGFGLFLSGTYWIYISVAVYGNAPAWIALLLMLGLTLMMSMYFWLTGWMISSFSRGEPWLLLIVAPACWVLIEWLRGWFLTGFPWMALGYSHVDSSLAGWAPLLGIYGVSAMLVLSTSAMLAAIMTGKRQRLIALVIAVLPWISGAILKTVDWTNSAGAPISITLIQGGISQDKKWLPEQLEPTLKYYRETTAKLSDSDIVVWPEVSIPSVTDLMEDYIAALERDSVRNSQTIIFGMLERDEDRTGKVRVRNSMIMLDGQSRQYYRKRHLVPFGEYFPVPGKVRSWLRMMNLPFSDLTAGADMQPLLVAANGTKIAVAICYEDAFGAEQLYALPEAEVLINASNDGWFGDSIAPHQHLQIARMRSLEVGRSAVRATNTGISAFIGPRGKILKSGPQFVPVTLTMDVEPRTGSTPYANSGNLPIVGFSFLIVAGFWLRSRAS